MQATSLATSVISTPDFMANIASHQTALSVGAFPAGQAAVAVGAAS